MILGQLRIGERQTTSAALAPCFLFKQLHGSQCNKVEYPSLPSSKTCFFCQNGFEFSERQILMQPNQCCCKMILESFDKYMLQMYWIYSLQILICSIAVFQMEL